MFVLFSNFLLFMKSSPRVYFSNILSGTISKLEAREALRANKGNIWVAVTDCVETRQKKVKIMFKGTVSVISCTPPGKDGNARFIQQYP